MYSKDRQREIVKESVRNMSSAEKRHLSYSICNHLANMKEIKEAKVILSYMALDNEVNLDPLNEYLETQNKVVCFPLVEANNMNVYFSKTGNYKPGSFGIREPIKAESVLMDPLAIDVAIVPCVGFDSDKNRLGHGLGYYDMYLPECDAIKIGVGFEKQHLEQITTGLLDVCMDYIVTEEKIYR